MKLRSLALIALLAISLSGYTQEKTIELPLSIQNGFSPFPVSLMRMLDISEDDNSIFKNTLLKVSKYPEGLTDMKCGNIISDMFQHVYQNYLLGNIPEDLYIKSNAYRMWQDIDTLTLSRTPIQTRLAFAYGKDKDGMLKIAVDANGNLDLSDDRLFTPLERAIAYKSTNPGLDILTHSFNVPFEIFIQNKITPVSIPLFILFDSQANRFSAFSSLYATTQYKGVQIAVAPNRQPLYQSPQGISLTITDNLKKGELVKAEDISGINDYIEIKDEIYKIIGVNINNFTLVLEKTGLPKSNFFTAQVGYKPHPCQGEEITTKSAISLESLKGKYVLIDFWAEWCAPCLKELPRLKELYSKTDRSKFEIIGIAGGSSLGGIKRLIKQHEITWPQILSDETNKITETYRINAYPTTILIDPEGIVISKDLRGKELEEKILSLINK